MAPFSLDVQAGGRATATHGVAGLHHCILGDRTMSSAPPMLAELQARVEELERQGKSKTPQNSSLPPSSQHPHARSQPPRHKSKKKRGGQPGHEKHERPLIPTNECDDVQLLKPTECRRCGAKLSGNDPEPLRHQVWELPEIKPEVTEYGACPWCARMQRINLRHHGLDRIDDRD